MNLQSIRWRLPLSYAAIALITALSLGSVMLLVLNQYYTGLESAYLLDNAQALQPVVQRIITDEKNNEKLQEQITTLAFISQIRIRVLDENATAIADSGIPDNIRLLSLANDPANVVFISEAAPENAIVVHSKPDETTAYAFGTVSLAADPPAPGENMETIIAIKSAPLGGYVFSNEQNGWTGSRSAQVVSITLSDSSHKLEISSGPAYGSDILKSVAIAWGAAGILSVILAISMGLYASRQVTRPVLALIDATRQMEQGQLSARVNLPNEQQQEFQSLAAAFNNMAQRVEKTISTLRAFVSDAAHELNTPLTALKTNLELALNESDPASQINYLASALEQNQRLEQLTGRLLDLSRIEYSQTTPDFSHFDLRQLVAEIGERFASRAEQADRNFSLALPGRETPLFGNPYQLQRAIENLLENSFKFTPPGGNITLELVIQQDAAQCIISDTGIGIPDDDLPHLFKRFHRGRNAGGFPGSGLGLAIVRSVMDAHHGSVEAQNLETGCRFVMRLPMA